MRMRERKYLPMKFLQKRMPLVLAITGILCLVVAIILFATAVPNGEGYKKVLSTVCAVLLLVLTALIVIYLFLSRDTDPNFFLFDRAKRRNIPVDKLTFSIVNERMTFFLGLVCETPEQLWLDGVLDDNRKFGYRGVYKPLVAYKMLYDLGEKDMDSSWELLRTATPLTMNSLCDALERGGEQEMVKAFRYIYENYSNDTKKMQDFIRGNQRYLRGKMLAYVKRHIELFY